MNILIDESYETLISGDGKQFYLRIEGWAGPTSQLISVPLTRDELLSLSHQAISVLAVTNTRSA